MILKNIKEKVVTALSLVWSLFQVAHSYLISCYPMVRAFGVCLSQRFSKNIMTEPMCRICRLTNFNCGIVLVTILVCIALLFNLSIIFFLLNFIEELIRIFCTPSSTIFNIPFRSLHFPVRNIIFHSERRYIPYTSVVRLCCKITII